MFVTIFNVITQSLHGYPSHPLDLRPPGRVTGNHVTLSCSSETVVGQSLCYSNWILLMSNLDTPKNWCTIIIQNFEQYGFTAK